MNALEIITRTEAADRIASTLDDAGYSASTWSPEGDQGPVRVYVTIPAASRKKKSKDCGYLSVEFDGSITSQLDRQSGTIFALLPSLTIAPVEAKPRQFSRPKAGYQDDDAAQFEQSQEAMRDSESRREES